MSFVGEAVAPHSTLVSKSHVLTNSLKSVPGWQFMMGEARAPLLQT